LEAGTAEKFLKTGRLMVHSAAI